MRTPLYELVMFLGWGATAALITLLWRRRYPERSMVPGVMLGLVIGLLWLVTLWVAVGLWWYWRGQAAPPTAAKNPARLAAIVAACIVGFVVTAVSLDALGGDSEPGPSVVPTETAQPNPPTTTPESVAPPEVVTVVRVIDGDTVELADGRTVRVLGIDTPEVNSGAECWGPEASRFARDVLLGREVRLAADPTQDAVDRYGRTLAYLLLSDGANYSVLAAEAGVAFAYTYDQETRLTSQIRSAETNARTADRGVWGSPCFGTRGPTPAPEPEPEPDPEPDPAPIPPADPSGNCEPGYHPCVPVYPPDVDCSDVNGPITVTGSDPHGLDGNGDGVGCE